MTRWRVGGAIAAAFLVFVASGLFTAETARACSYAGPVSFHGFAALLDVETLQATRIPFDGVSIDSLCQTANGMDVDGSLAFVSLPRGVRLFSLARDAGFLDLGLDRPVAPALDGDFVYYGSYEDDALFRTRVTTRVREVVLHPALFGASGIAAMEVGGGIAAWMTYDVPPRLHVYDVSSGAFILRDGAMPRWPGLPADADAYLLSVDGGRLRFLVGTQDVGEYDAISNSTWIVTRLPDQVESPREVAVGGDRYVYRQAGGLVLYDSNLNTTRVLSADPRAVNPAMAGNLVAYNFHIVEEGLPLWLTLSVVVAIVVVVTAAVARFARLRKP